LILSEKKRKTKRETKKERPGENWRARVIGRERVCMYANKRESERERERKRERER